MSAIVRRLAPLLCAFFLVSCGAAKAPAPAPGPEPVGSVTLQTNPQAPTDEQALDIGILVFDTQASKEEVARSGAAIFAQIRETETQYLPSALRGTLLVSNQWGVVRVLPQADPSMDLLISGSIRESDGARLLLHIRAVDSTGQVWLERDYADNARVADYPDTGASLLDNGGLRFNEDPFVDLYAAIANDLLRVRQGMTQEQLSRVRNVTALRYASDLSPEAFAPYLETAADGLLEVSRLPASNDPLLEHVADIKARHGVFIDTIDEYYEALYQDVKPIYDIWRQYSFEQVTEERRSVERARSGNTNPSSFEAISQNYNRYKWSKIFEQEFVALASGFVSETAPAVLELSRNVNGLSGPVEAQYAQWRELLRGLFEIETEGLQAAKAATP